jgi:hypothetical protein
MGHDHRFDIALDDDRKQNEFATPNRGKLKMQGVCSERFVHVRDDL